MVEPDETFVLRNSEPTLQISEMVKKLHRIFMKIKKPKVVVSLADTNTALAAGICAVKNKIRLIHVEAGLRSHDWRMPEEHNRIALDHLSDVLLAPTNYNKNNLLKENVNGTIHTTGNTIIDAVAKNVSIAKMKAKIEIPSQDFALVTLHRAENVDDEKTLVNLVNSLIKAPLQMVFPLHPRTRIRLKTFDLYNKIKRANNIRLIKPVGYFDFLVLMQRCKFLISDSGGIQEEVTSPLIRKKLLLVRKSTERQEAVEAGFVRVVGTRQREITYQIKQIIDCKEALPRSSPYGKGNSGKKIANLLLLHASKL